MLTARLVLGHADRGVDAKKIHKQDDFPDAQPGDVVFTGFVGVARDNVFWQGGDHLFLASPEYVFSGHGRCYYGLEIEFPVGTPVQVIWTEKGFEVQKLDIRNEYSFDLLEFLRNEDPWCEDLPFTRPNAWTRVWHLAGAPQPWELMHRLLLIEVMAGCPDNEFSWEQDVAPQQVLVIEGALYQSAGEAPISYGLGILVSNMDGTQHIRTDPAQRTRFLAFYDGPQ